MRERLPDVPIIALTAHAMADEKEALLKAGMNDYQTKPISQEQLADCIQRWSGYVATRLLIEAFCFVHPVRKETTGLRCYPHKYFRGGHDVVWVNPGEEPPLLQCTQFRRGVFHHLP